ncbi:MAG: two-component system response regulator [Deltaproteobacteria bacterium HGW-Deltaproteobacteria-13]|nr:MAG: two-component system response regulator [Deltaproteobacteria bacterium HGW-Deltaproteobacteria-13]
MIKVTQDILLVEDNPADVELILDALSETHAAHQVKVLRDAEEAIDYIFKTGPYRSDGGCRTPKLIFLDLDLPKIDGLEILRRIRSNKQTRKIPVAILTSSLMDKDRIESYNLGVNNYIMKPVCCDNFARDCVAMFLKAIVMNESLPRAK